MRGRKEDEGEKKGVGGTECKNISRMWVRTLLFLKNMLHLDFLSWVDDVIAAETLFLGSNSMITRFWNELWTEKNQLDKVYSFWR